MSSKLVRLIPFLLLFAISFTTKGQIVVYNQRYQVEHMPQPKSFTSYNAFALQNEKLSTPSTDYSYPKRYHRVTGNIIPIANNESKIISLGFGYATDWVESNTTPVRQVNQALWTQLYTTGSIGEKYYWRWIYAFGTYGEDISFRNSARFKHSLSAHFGRKWNSNFATSLGLLYLSNFGDNQYIPSAHLIYSTGKWVFDLFIPNDIKLRFIQDENLHFLLVNTLTRRSYYDSNIEKAYKYTINEIGLQTEFRITGVLWGELSLTKPYGMKWEIQDRSNYTSLGDVTQALSINGGLFIRFQEKYN